MNMPRSLLTTAQHIHFVGIGGIGMSGIAQVLYNLGFTVSGSDLLHNHSIACLQALGINIAIGHHARNIGHADVIVKSAAVGDDNCEIQAALANAVAVVARGQMLAELMQLQKGIAIAGTHGKTTTTSLLARIFTQASLSPTYIIGGKLTDAASNACLGEGDYFIAEADESDASFLHLRPHIAVVTNIDEEHMSAYQYDVEQLKQAFIDFLGHILSDGLAVLCIDDPVVRSILPCIKCTTLTYGMAADADIRIYHSCHLGLQSHFQIASAKLKLAKSHIVLNMLGMHNVANAVAAIVIALYCKIEMRCIQKALLDFSGVNRRFQVHGTKCFDNREVTLIDDYGHHPVEICATLTAISRTWPNERIIHIFQPHRFTRTRDLFDGFVKSLSGSEVLLLLDVYPASEQPIAEADSHALYHAIRQSGVALQLIYVRDVTDIPNILTSIVEDGDIVLTQGAGDVGDVVLHLLETVISEVADTPAIQQHGTCHVQMLR